MDKFVRWTGTAAVFRAANVDTDKLIPKQYLTTLERTGLGRGLLHELRYDAAGQEDPSFVLNREPYRQATILVGGENFGCGSSREHAVWALLDFGIRCVMAPSFGAIFRNNCFKNGVLPVELSVADIDRIVLSMTRTRTPVLAVDLAQQRVELPDGDTVAFAVEDARRRRLLEGLDDIEVTLRRAPVIAGYARRSQAAFPWLWQHAGSPASTSAAAHQDEEHGTT